MARSKKLAAGALDKTPLEEVLPRQVSITQEVSAEVSALEPSDETTRGGLGGVQPGSLDGFDGIFYLATYPDVASYDNGPRVHFERFGRREGRYGSERALLEDEAVLLESGKFDFAYYKLMNGGFQNPVRDFLLNAAARVDPEKGFDREFVAAYYPRSLAGGETPFMLYCRAHRSNWFFCSYAAVENDVLTMKSSALYSEPHLRAELLHVSKDLDPAVYYCTEGFRLCVDPSPAFSTRGYVLDNPDIAATAINPFVHWISHGVSEGRQCRRPKSVVSEKGKRRRENGKATVLVISHEASRSGAPIVGLNLARTFCTDYNVVTILMRPGQIYASFLKFSTEVVISGDTPGALWLAIDALTARMTVDLAILNSVECTNFLPVLVDYQIPTISLIHEFPQYCYPFFLHAKAIALSNLIVYPARIVRDQALLEMERLGVQSIGVGNIVVASQGRPVLPPSDVHHDREGIPPSIKRRLSAGSRPFVVLGAGWVQPRKGVDLFIEAARVARNELDLDCVFIWVGPNFDPEGDLSLSVYLADQVEQSELNGVVYFVKEQATLKPFWDIADLFFVSSRLDPFPNVAIDAIGEGIPVVCFERATGIAELNERWPDRVIAVPYNATADVAGTVATLLQSRLDRGGPIRIPLTEEVQAFLSFQRYADSLSLKARQLIKSAAENRAAVEILRADPDFNAGLFFVSLPWWMKSSIIGPTRTSLAKIAALCTTNGVELGYLSPGKVARGEWGAAPLAGASQQFPAARPLPASTMTTTTTAYSAIILVNDPAELGGFCDYLLTIGRLEKVAIVGSGFSSADLELLQSVVGQQRLTIIDGSQPSHACQRILSEFSCGTLVHVISTPFGGDYTASAEALNLSEGQMREAFSALAADDTLQIVVQEPSWKRLEHRKRFGELVGGQTLISRRLVDLRQCYCRIDPNTWSSTFLLELIEHAASHREDSLWDTLTKFISSGQQASWAIVSAWQVGMRPPAEFL